NYDRNRLLSATSAGTTAAYNYDPYGRLNTVTAAGQVIERLTYDGFDRTIEHEKINDTGGLDATTYDYDPLDRTTTKTAEGETTEFAYLGLTDKVITEEIGGQVERSYAYSAWGARLSQVKHDTDGTGPEVTEDSFYGYNPHTDVETLTSESGDTRATYGYTAYGKDDEEAFTGIDKPDAQNPGQEPYNFYRYNGKRWDPSSGSYDMGFRDYNPGLNRFTTRDTYNGALADLNLGTDPWTGNRYAFTSGNPISRIEIDGHYWDWFEDAVNDTGGGGSSPSSDDHTKTSDGCKLMKDCGGTINGPTVTGSDAGHFLLDLGGLFPFLGNGADGANCGWYGAEGDAENAAMSCAGAAPIAGIGVTIAKYARKFFGKGTDEVGGTIIQNNKVAGDAASDAIKDRYPGSVRETSLDAPSGRRVIDVLTPQGLAIESKVGRTSLTKDVRRQIQRDVELRSAGNPVSSVEWHFSSSPTTGLSGPTGPLREALQKAGISIVEW
ncbi:RHS repeat-associated core domain-containing protein, partial [Amycolatopsis palatopharyngis]|uniref:RHS repeat-associated core domain-containing protein n=1 Tax=Amycolatopsis palatopharyngis TaxID=187982 RepID=UPI0013BEA012